MDGSQAAALNTPLERLRSDFHSILRGALSAIDPVHLIGQACTRGLLDDISRQPPLVVSAGKAAWPMARALAQHVTIGRGLVAGPRAGRAPLPARFEWIASAHPEPDARSVEAGLRALALAGETGADRALVVLLSGGASAMLAVPAPPISVEEKARVARALMDAGAAIDQLNCVRKHLSTIKGGRLAAAAERSLTLAISDVHSPRDDDPSVIGSGPTVADPTTFADALGIIEQVALAVPPTVREFLERGAAGGEAETIKPGDARLGRAEFAVIGSRRDAVAGARRAAEAAGYTVEIIDAATTGEARNAAPQFLAEARRRAAYAPRPLCVIGSGETTVKVKGRGRGGRNQEFVIAAAPSLATIGRAALLASAGTDGIDGPTDAAGGIVDSSTLDRAARAGVDALAALEENDAFHFLGPLGDLIELGPTGTNVGDLQVLLIA